jgi:CheY-like chemotaxis protein
MVPVLIVEEEAAYREAAALVLREEGFAVIEVDNARDAINILLVTSRRCVALVDAIHGPAVIEAAAAGPFLAERHAFALLAFVYERPSATMRKRMNALVAPIVE